MGDEGARCLVDDSGEWCWPERSDDLVWEWAGRKGMMGETGDVEREAKNEVVVGDRDGSTGLLVCRAFNPGARE